MQRNFLAVFMAVALILPACSQSEKSRKSSPKTVFKITKTEAEWKAQLSPQQYEVLRQRGTEAAFSGEYWDNHKKGTYVCAGCRQPLFNADTKFESGTGWPSFFKPISDSLVLKVVDRSHGMVRDEVVCSRCGGHLGHVFDDGPAPTGLRYCLNSAALHFENKKSE